MLEAGHRVVAYDRRGFGRSSRPIQGYNFDTLASDLDTLLSGLELRDVTLDVVHSLWNAGVDASPWGTWACVPTWLEDFTDDIKRIDIPTLILHGSDDRIRSVEGQGRRLHAALPDARYVEIDGAPLTRKAMEWFWDAYTTDPAERAEITASPNQATTEQLEGLPPTLLLVDEVDPLRDEGEAYAAKLRARGSRSRLSATTA